MTDRQDLIEYNDSAVTQYEDVGSDVREAYERHKGSRDVIEYDDSRPLGDVIRASVDHVKNKGELRARQQHGPGTSLNYHWDRLPAGVRSDVKELQQWRDFAAPLMPFAELCQRNGTNIYTALRQYNGLENIFIQDPCEGFVAICRRQGIDPQVMARAFWQRVFDPQSWAASRVNDSSYQTGASHMAGAAMQADINAFMKANPGAEHFRADMVNLLSGVNFEAGVSNWQMLTWALGQAVKDARAKAAAVKKASKAVGGSPGSNRASRSTVGGSSTTDAILEAINAQRGLV
jgi:hypothetical protein